MSLFWATVVNSALYLSGCVAAGLVTGNPWAWKAGLAAIGLTYVSFHLQYTMPGKLGLCHAAVVASIAAGLLAGAALLVR